MAELSFAEVDEILKLDADTGRLFWKERGRHLFEEGKTGDRIWRSWNGRFAGKEAFTTIGRDGYRRGAIHWKNYLAHRVVWLLHEGEWPAAEVDHINGDRGDNRLENLRAVSRLENSRNCKLRSSNTSGVTGVGWSRRAQKWMAHICVEGEYRHLGLFKSIYDAKAVRLAAQDGIGFTERHGF